MGPPFRAVEYFPTSLAIRSGWGTGPKVSAGGGRVHAAMVTVFTGSELVLGVFVGIVVALWLLTTSRHAFTGIAVTSPRDAEGT